MGVALRGRVFGHDLEVNCGEFATLISQVHMMNVNSMSHKKSDARTYATALNVFTTE